MTPRGLRLSGRRMRGTLTYETGRERAESPPRLLAYHPEVKNADFDSLCQLADVVPGIRDVVLQPVADHGFCEARQNWFSIPQQHTVYRLPVVAIKDKDKADVG